jgi:hypothetical protein
LLTYILNVGIVIFRSSGGARLSEIVSVVLKGLGTWAASRFNPEPFLYSLVKQVVGCIDTGISEEYLSTQALTTSLALTEELYLFVAA